MDNPGKDLPDAPNITNEYMASNLIDLFLKKVRDGFLLNFFENNQTSIIKWGLYGLYISAIIGAVISITLPVKYNGYIEWGTSLSLGCGFIVYCLIAHYIAVKFIPNVDGIIKKAPSQMRSSAFLDVFSFLLITIGIFSLIGGLVFSIKNESFGLFLIGIFWFIWCAYLTSICLNPKIVNISIEEDITPAEEFIGLISLFIKAPLKMTPVIFGSCVILGILNICTIPFSKYQYVREITDDLTSAGYFYIFALAPILGYLYFLVYYFSVDILTSILSLKKRDT